MYQDPTVIEHILATCRTIAVVGFSSKTYRAGYYVPTYLQKQGYRIIPVNPLLREGLGERAYPDLLSVPEPVDVVLVFRRSEEVLPVVEQAVAIGAKGVWMQEGVWNERAAQLAREKGLDVVMDRCMMVEHRRRRT